MGKDNEYPKGDGMFESVGFALYPGLGKEEEREERQREEVEEVLVALVAHIGKEINAVMKVYLKCLLY